MEFKEKILGTRIFKTVSIISILLFLSFWFRQELWSELWIIYGVFFLGVVIAFIISIIWSLVFWIRENKNYGAAFTPFLITVFVLGILVFLPITKIKTNLKFSDNKATMEGVVTMILKDNPKRTKYPSTFKLPKKYEHLSVGGGEVIIANTPTSRAILFYTFRGVPDGMNGFLKLSENGDFLEFKDQFNIYKYEFLGDNWYYISGE